MLPPYPPLSIVIPEPMVSVAAVHALFPPWATMLFPPLLPANTTVPVPLSVCVPENVSDADPGYHPPAPPDSVTVAPLSVRPLTIERLLPGDTIRFDASVTPSNVPLALFNCCPRWP